MGKTTEVGSSPTQQLKMDRHTPTRQKAGNRDRGKNQMEGDPPPSSLSCGWDRQGSDFSF